MKDSTKSTPSRPRPLPLVVGITGHRDLREKDHEPLKQKIRKIFAELRQRYPATPLILLSPLAEGADRLAAQVALELDIRLVVPLPMPKDEYEKDFETPQSKADFNELLHKAERSFALSGPEESPEINDLVKEKGRAGFYALVGAYIARHSQILIALWDGVASTKPGGTAEVVRFKLEGVPPPYAPPRSQLDPVESGPVYHILTPRIKNPSPAGTAFALDKHFPGYVDEAVGERIYHRIYQRFDNFNRDAQRLATQLTDAHRESMAYVLTPEQQQSLPSGLKFALDRYGWADALALHFQRRMRQTVRGVLLIALLAAICIQAYSQVVSGSRWLAGAYLVAMCVAYAWYVWARRRDYHNKYLDYRALAEGLRVHLFWRLARLKEEVPDHYLRRQRGELDWIRQAIRVWTIPTKMEAPTDHPDPVAKHPERLQIVLDRWVSDQAAYFRKAGRRDHWRSMVLRYVEYGFFIAGLILAFIKVLLPLLEPILAGVSMTRDHTGTDNVHKSSLEPILPIMSMSLVVGALLHIYAKVLSLAEHAKQYGRMSEIFSLAEDSLQGLLKAGDLEGAHKLIKDLGQEALAENGDWVLLHRERPLEMPQAH